MQDVRKQLSPLKYDYQGHLYNVWHIFKREWHSYGKGLGRLGTGDLLIQEVCF